MQAIAGAGAASGDDAAARAVREATAGLDSPELVLVFPTGVDAARAAAGAAEAAGGARVAGITGGGAIGSDGAIEIGCSAVAFDRTVQAGVGIARGARQGLEAAAARAVHEALAEVEAAPGRTAVLLLLDTRTGDQADAIAGAYGVAGPMVPLAGGAAGGQEPAQLIGGESLTGAVIAVALVAPRAIGIGNAHGCRMKGAPSIVTQAEGRMVLELDGKPAAEAYLEAHGMGGARLSDAEFEALAVTHPLAQPELSGDARIRHVLRRSGDGLECATHIPPNAAIEYTDEMPDDIVEACPRAVRRALARLDGRRPRAAIVFDCAGRKRAVAGSLSHEVAALHGAFADPRPPTAGLFTHGEIARVRGAKGDRNHAIVVVVLD
jgi:hypothetical protein